MSLNIKNIDKNYREFIRYKNLLIQYHTYANFISTISAGYQAFASLEDEKFRLSNSYIDICSEFDYDFAKHFGLCPNSIKYFMECKSL